MRYLEKQSVAGVYLWVEMDRRRSERLRTLEEAVGVQLAELRVDARDPQQAARAGR